MPTYIIPLFTDNAFIFDTTGGTYWEPFDVKATNDRWLFGSIWFDDGSNAKRVDDIVRIPPGIGTITAASIKGCWTTGITTGNVVFDFDYRAVSGDNLESLDQFGVSESVTVTKSAPGAAFRKMDFSISLTASNFEAGDLIECSLGRDLSDANDTLAGSCTIIKPFLEITTS